MYGSKRTRAVLAARDAAGLRLRARGQPLTQRMLDPARTEEAMTDRDTPPRPAPRRILWGTCADMPQGPGIAASRQRSTEEISSRHQQRR